MKKLKDFEKEINKCSKCGLCQGVCPVFEATGNECAVSKGKFVMLSGVLKGDLALSPKINSYLDLCLKCDKCSQFCPAGIEVCEILQTAKYEYISRNPLHKFPPATLPDCILDLAGKFIPRKKSQGQRQILYFKGCVNKIYPRTENSLKTILGKADIHLVDLPFSCCGMPFYSSGRLEQFEELKAGNTRLINDSEYEYLLTDCASCENTLKHYGTINKKIINAETLLTELGLTYIFNKKQKVVFHRPCHLENTEFLTQLIKSCENIEFIDIPDSCCGLAGDFVLKKPWISNKLAAKRAKEIVQSGAKIVLTSCPACVIGLKKALFGTGIKVYNIIDFLNHADKIKGAG